MSTRKGFGIGGALDREPTALVIFVFMCGVLLLILSSNNTLNPIGTNASITGSFNQATTPLFLGANPAGGQYGIWMIIFPTIGFVYLRAWLRHEEAEASTVEVVSE